MRLLTHLVFWGLIVAIVVLLFIRGPTFAKAFGVVGLLLDILGAFVLSRGLLLRGRTILELQNMARDWREQRGWKRRAFIVPIAWRIAGVVLTLMVGTPDIPKKGTDEFAHWFFRPKPGDSVVAQVSDTVFGLLLLGSGFVLQGFAVVLPRMG
jgi:hypothetical protein